MSMPVVLVGLGRMGAYLARGLLADPLWSLQGIVDPRPDLDAEVERVTGQQIPVFTGITQAALSTGARAAVVAAPTVHHPQLVAEALGAGLHVFCEKPLSFDPAESDTLADVADKARLTLQIGFFRRFAAPWVGARDAIRADQIGPPVYLRSSTWDQDLPDLRFAAPKVSGGLMIDNGVHEFDVIPWLCGSPVARVTARHAPDPDGVLAAVGDHTCSVVMLELVNGVVATVDLSRNARYTDDMRTEILGTRGAVFVECSPAGRLTIGTAAGRADVTSAGSVDGFTAAVSEELAAFHALCRGERLDYPDGHDSATAIRVAIAASTAALEGGWVEL